VGLWNEHDRVPVLVRFRASKTRINEYLSQALCEAFTAIHGVRVVNAYGKDGDEALTVLIQSEKNLMQYSDITKAIVACARAAEGMDSPVRCLGISIGMPRSSLLLNQLIGRIMRGRYVWDFDDEGYPKPERTSRFAGFPQKWLDQSKQIFLVEDTGKAAQDNYKASLLLSIALLDTSSAIRKLLKSIYKTTLLNKREAREKLEILLNEDTNRGVQIVNEALAYWYAHSSELDYPIENDSRMVMILATEYQTRSSFDSISVAEDSLRNALMVIAAERANSSNNPVLKTKVAEILFGNLDRESILDELSRICEEFKLGSGAGLRSPDIAVIAARVKTIGGGVGSLQEVDDACAKFVSVNHRQPKLRDRMVGTNKSFIICDNYLKGLLSDDGAQKYPGGLSQRLIERTGVDWRSSINRLAESYRMHANSNQVDFWNGSHNDDPVKVYLEPWIRYVAKGKSISDRITLSSACLSQPNR
jgi:hypothetical protein